MIGVQQPGPASSMTALPRPVAKGLSPGLANSLVRFPCSPLSPYRMSARTNPRLAQGRPAAIETGGRPSFPGPAIGEPAGKVSVVEPSLVFRPRALPSNHPDPIFVFRPRFFGRSELRGGQSLGRPVPYQRVAGRVGITGHQIFL
jgi:hypothetical protein